MNKTTNILASIFDWLGEVFERFNPAAFRFLAAILPYATPLPVAWLSSNSATTFLNFPPKIAFIFVFALEGMGLWFTSLFVDSVVDWVRSRNWKSSAMVLLFGLVVTAYIAILVNLNVILESASGNTNPALSRVITLLCFLPLLTGVGNGYYKLKLEQKTDVQIAQQRELEREAAIRRENNDLKLKSKMIKAGMNPMEAVYQATVNATPQIEPKAKEKKASDYKTHALEYMDEVWSKEKRIVTPSELTTYVNKRFRVSLEHGKVKGTWSNFVKEWKLSKGIK